MEKHFQDKLDALVKRLNAEKQYRIVVTGATDSQIDLEMPDAKCIKLKEDGKIVIPSSVKTGTDRWSGRDIKRAQWTPGGFKKVVKEFARELAAETGKKVKITHEQETAMWGFKTEIKRGNFIYEGEEGRIRATATLHIG